MSTISFKDVLKDGTPVLIRSLNPCDREIIKHGFEELSPESRYLRFFTPIKGLSDMQLASLTDADDSNHVVVAAMVDQGNKERGIGLARFVRLAEEPDAAECAVTVIDAFQRKGVGSILLNVLKECARENNIRILRGYVLPVNRRVIKLLNIHGVRKGKESEGLLCYEIEV